MLGGLGRIDVGRVADHDHADHAHAVMRLAAVAVDPRLLQGDRDLLVELAGERLGSLRQHAGDRLGVVPLRSEEHTSELQSLMRISYAVFCLKKKKTQTISNTTHTNSQQINYSTLEHNKIID